MKMNLFLSILAITFSCQLCAQVNNSPIANYFRKDSLSITYVECTEKATKKKAATCRSFKNYTQISSGMLIIRTEESLTQDAGYSKISTYTVQLKDIDFHSAQILEFSCKNTDMIRQKYYSLGFTTISNLNKVKQHTVSSDLGEKESYFSLISLPFSTKEDATLALKYLEDKLKEENKPKLVLPLSIYQGTNKKYGLKDAKATVVIEPTYDYLFKNNLGYFVIQKDKKRGLLNAKGKELIPIKYDYLVDFSDNLLHVKLNSKSGFIDSTGKEVIPLVYDEVRSFKNGVSAARNGLKWGAIDIKNNAVIHFNYDQLDAISDTIFVFLSGNQYGLLSLSNRIILPPTYDNIQPWFGFPAIVTKNELSGLINEQGKVITPLKYQQIKNFFEGYSNVKQANKWGLVDSTGKQIGLVKYDYIGGFKNDRAIVNIGGKMCFQDAGCWEGGKWGFIDKTGKEIIPLIYTNARVFSEGLAAVSQNGKWGFIDVNGKVMVPIQFDEAKNFERGRTSVRKGEEYFNIDKTGKRIE